MRRGVRIHLDVSVSRMTTGAVCGLVWISDESLTLVRRTRFACDIELRLDVFVRRMTTRAVLGIARISDESLTLVHRTRFAPDTTMNGG